MTQFDRRSRSREVRLPGIGEAGYFSKEVLDFLELLEPGNPEEAFEGIMRIWGEQGFVHPKDILLTYLSQKIAEPGKAEKEADLHTLINAQYPESLFLPGFDTKTALPVITGLARMYALTHPETPVVHINGDFGNMGGTNKYFYSLLRTQRYHQTTPTEQDEGHAYTDRIAAATAHIAKAKLEKYIHTTYPKNDFSICALRAGGDELHFIVTGVPEGIVHSAITDFVTPAIENYLTANGLRRHRNPKNDKPEFRGFSLGLATCEMGYQDNNYYEMISIENDEIKKQKYEIGTQRIISSPSDPETDLEHILSESAPPPLATQDVDEQLGIKRAIHCIPFASPDEFNQKRFDALYAKLSTHLNDGEREIFRRVMERHEPIDQASGTFTDLHLTEHILRYIDDCKTAEVDGLPYLMHVEFGGLPTINNIAGNAVADQLLKEEARMMREAAVEAGLAQCLDIRHGIYHQGGAKFTLLIPPALHHEDRGTRRWTPINEEQLDRFKDALETKRKEFTERPLLAAFEGIEERALQDYLDQRHVKIPAGELKIKQLRGIARQEELGITLMTYNQKITKPDLQNPETTVSAQVAKLRREAEKKVERKRVLRAMTAYGP